MAARVLTSRVEGPLAGLTVGYESWLAGKGICRRAIRDRLWQFRYLSEWLERRGLSAVDLDRRRAEEHLAERREAGCVGAGLAVKPGVAVGVSARDRRRAATYGGAGGAG